MLRKNVGGQRRIGVLRDTDPADGPAVAHHPSRFLVRGRADAFEHRVGAVTAGKFADAFDTLFATLGHHVGGAEVAPEVGALADGGPSG